MTMTMFEWPGWKFVVEERPNPLEYRLHIWIDHRDNREVLVGWDDGGLPQTILVDHGMTAPFPGFRIPRIMAEALILANKPQPDRQGEVTRLEEALAIERERVDSVLDRMLRSME